MTLLVTSLPLAQWLERSTGTQKQLRPQGLLLVENDGSENPGNSLEFRHVNTMKCLRFVWTTVSHCRKQTRPPDARNNLHRHVSFVMCHVTKYSTILGVFQQPWPGFLRSAILNEEKALGTSLVRKVLGFFFAPSHEILNITSSLTLQLHETLFPSTCDAMMKRAF